MNIKDGTIDKLSAFVEDLNRQGLHCTVIGLDTDVLDAMCCDVHRLMAIQQMCNASAYALLLKYNEHKEKRDAQHH